MNLTTNKCKACKVSIKGISQNNKYQRKWAIEQKIKKGGFKQGFKEEKELEGRRSTLT